MNSSPLACPVKHTLTHPGRGEKTRSAYTPVEAHPGSQSHPGVRQGEGTQPWPPWHRWSTCWSGRGLHEMGRRAAGLDVAYGARGPEAWCPRKGLGLHPQHTSLGGFGQAISPASSPSLI